MAENAEININPGGLPEINFTLDPELEKRMSFDQKQIWLYEARMYYEILDKAGKNEEVSGFELIDRALRYQRLLDMYAEFMVHPENFRPTRLAWVSAAGKVIDTIYTHAESARTPEEKQIAMQVYNQIQQALWKNLPQEIRDHLSKQGIDRLSGTLLWARPLLEIDEFMREKGRKGVVEIVKEIVPFDIKTELAWGTALGGTEKEPIIRHHYTLQLPYTRDGWGNIKPGKSTYEFERGGIAFSLEDWVERVPKAE